MEIDKFTSANESNKNQTIKLPQRLIVDCFVFNLKNSFLGE